MPKFLLPSILTQNEQYLIIFKLVEGEEKEMMKNNKVVPIISILKYVFRVAKIRSQLPRQHNAQIYKYTNRMTSVKSL